MRFYIYLSLILGYWGAMPPSGLAQPSPPPEKLRYRLKSKVTRIPSKELLALCAERDALTYGEARYRLAWLLQNKRDHLREVLIYRKEFPNNAEPSDWEVIAFILERAEAVIVPDPQGPFHLSYLDPEQGVVSVRYELAPRPMANGSLPARPAIFYPVLADDTFSPFPFPLCPTTHPEIPLEYTIPAFCPAPMDGEGDPIPCPQILRERIESLQPYRVLPWAVTPVPPLGPLPMRLPTGAVDAQRCPLAGVFASRCAAPRVGASAKYACFNAGSSPAGAPFRAALARRRTGSS